MVQFTHTCRVLVFKERDDGGSRCRCQGPYRTLVKKKMLYHQMLEETLLCKRNGRTHLFV